MPSAAARKGCHGSSYRKHVDADPTWLGRCCLPYTPLPSRRNYDPGASGPPRGLWPALPSQAPRRRPSAKSQKQRKEDRRPSVAEAAGGNTRVHTDGTERARAPPRTRAGRGGRRGSPSHFAAFNRKGKEKPLGGRGQVQETPTRARAVGWSKAEGEWGLRSRGQFAEDTIPVRRRNLFGGRMAGAQP